MIYNLKTNDNVTPINVSSRAFVSFTTKDIAPKTYRVTVTEGGAQVFDTGVQPYGTVKTQLKFPLKPTTKYDWQVTVADENGKEESASSYFETALLDGFDNRAKWINTGALVIDAGMTKDTKAMFMKKKFTLEKVPADAKMYYCALGAGEVYINGKRVGEGFLSPSVTKYDKRALYLAENVTDFLKEGENCIAVMVGNGFYNQTVEDNWSFNHATWRDAPRMIMQVNFDGAPALFSDKSWLVTDRTPIVYNALRNGEFYDARLEKDWMGQTEPEGDFWTAAIATPIGGKLYPMEMPEIKVMNRIRPVSVTKTPSGKWLFDFGINLVGMCEIHMQAPAGATVMLRYAEKSADGEVDMKHVGQYIRTDHVQTDKYTFKGEGVEVWHARFTYHGFQYVEMTGLDQEPTLDSLVALQIYTAFDKIGDFSSSDYVLNTLYEIGERALVGNYHGIPTDCPHREKNGWTGDTALSSEQALMNYDIAPSYKKFMLDYMDNQRVSGQLSCIVPASSYWGYNWGFGPAWDTCFFTVPHMIKRYRGDNTVYAEIYESAKKYIDDFCSYYEEDHLVNFGLGDWCFPTKAPAPYNRVATLRLTSSAFYYYNVKVLADMARDLRKYQEAKRYEAKAEAIRLSILKHFVNEETGEVDGDIQTSLACVLFFHMVPKKLAKKVARRLNASVKKAGYHFYAGILGCKWIFASLSEYGYTETAYRAITNPGYPSYRNWVERGATTMWEDWEDGFSHNHHMYSDVCGWMMKYIAGLRLDEKENAYRVFTVDPKLIPQIDNAAAEVETPYGKAAVAWKRENGIFTITVTVPSGTKANVYMPDKTKRVLTEGVYTLTCNV
ncbi:MAG: family 78 glycoside hydrolase catalytic domain [Clostridia bacterium]|nr:family 78 glycoside hydrolase catalytic domain [Clostridia bacterium]